MTSIMLGARSWLDGQRDLQRMILKRERSLGMTPVAPSSCLPLSWGVPDLIRGSQVFDVLVEGKPLRVWSSEVGL